MKSSELSIVARLLKLIPVGKLFAIRANSEKITELFRKSICNFQGNYSVYHYNVANAHMRFKSSFKKAKSSKKASDLKILHESYGELHKLIYSGLQLYCSRVVHDLNDYFKSTRSGEASARVGLYFYVEEGLLNFAYKNDLKKPDQYTIFDTVCSENIPYLDNNIPKGISINSHNYMDASVSLERAKKYYSFFKFRDWMWLSRMLRSTEARICDVWQECVSDIRTSPNSGNSYLCKSHMAVPITFSKHQTTGLVAGVSALQRNNKEESAPFIFGVLVADYPETFYFDKTKPKASKYGNSDINAMYHYADIISLGVLVERNYFTNSRSVALYEKQFSEEAKLAREN